MKGRHKKNKTKKSKGEGQVHGKEEISTLSIAVPGSILENAQSPELRSYVAGQIARAAAIFQIDEIIIFDDVGMKNVAGDVKRAAATDDEDQSIRQCCSQFASILRYLECPQYLRKFFFPIHKDLQYCGLLNPLDSQHHMRQSSTFPFREGVTTNKKVKEGSNSTFVNVGLLNDVRVEQRLSENLRVTVKMDPGQDLKSKKLKGAIVSSAEPRKDTGIYWGYSVRIASSLTEVFTKAPYEDGYDLTLGTSDKGEELTKVTTGSLKYKHSLIVFGGLQGLEAAVESDDKLDVDDPSLLFDHYLNTIPNQGSRTVRTEEAILISLAALRDKLAPEKEAPEFKFVETIPVSEDTGVRFPDGRAPKKMRVE